MGSGFDFTKSVSEFLNYKLVDGYETNLDVFSEFLKIKGITQQTIEPFFQGARSEFLLESLNYYIDSRNVTSFGASGRYASCMKEYFLYITQKEYIKNNELIAEFGYPTYSDKSYQYKVNNYLDNKKEITASDGFEMFLTNQIDHLINDCNQIMNDDYILSKVDNSQMYYNKFRSAIMIKLILLTGTTYRTMTKINISDVDLQHCLITINDLTIHLPNKLIDQLRKYVEVRKIIVERNGKEDTSSLFTEFNGNEVSNTTSTLSVFLKDLTGRRDLNGLIKFSITNMIKKGINQSIIVKFTAVGDTIYNWCQEEVNKSMDLHSSKYLDSKIRSLEIFDLL